MGMVSDELDLLQGMEYLHSKGIVHFDMKVMLSADICRAKDRDPVTAMHCSSVLRCQHLKTDSCQPPLPILVASQAMCIPSLPASPTYHTVGCGAQARSAERP